MHLSKHPFPPLLNEDIIITAQETLHHNRCRSRFPDGGMLSARGLLLVSRKAVHVRLSAVKSGAEPNRVVGWGAGRRSGLWPLGDS